MIATILRRSSLETGVISDPLFQETVPMINKWKLPSKHYFMINYLKKQERPC